MSHFWKGNSEELIALCNKNDINTIIKYFKDDKDMLTILSISNSYKDLQRLSDELEYGEVQLSIFKQYLEEHHREHSNTITGVSVHFGTLLGAMAVASKLCYTKLQRNSAVITAIAAKEHFNHTIPNFDFDALVRYIYTHNNMCYVDDIIKDLRLDVEFKMHLKDLIKTNMFFSRRLGLPMQTLELIDQGFNYVQYLKLKEHPEDYGW